MENFSTPPQDSPRVLIIGCGGIGGVLGSRFLEAGVDLTIATTNETVRSIWATAGPQLDGRRLQRTLPQERLLNHVQESAQPFDVIFIAVQPPQIDEVIVNLQEHLSERGRVVCLPNGLSEDRMARVLGGERIVGAVVAWGARMPEPGCYLQTSPGGFSVGAYLKQDDPELATICRLLSHVGPVKITNNLRGARFSKLAINCAASTIGTIGGEKLGKLLAQTECRKIALGILHEAIRVARAEGIRLEPVIHLDLNWLTTEEPLSPAQRLLQHSLLLGVGFRYRKMRSSMLAAIERGRPPAVDFLNGEIVRRGERLGIPTPFNQAAQRIVWDIAEGRRTSGKDALRALAQAGQPN